VLALQPRPPSANEPVLLLSPTVEENTPWGHDEVVVVACGMDICDADVAGCSSERSGVMVQATDDPPDLALVLPEMMIQGAKEQDKVDVQIMASCFDMELTEVELDGLSAAEDLKVSGAPCTEKSSKGLIQMDADEPLEKASPSPRGEFFEELALTVLSPMQIGETAPSLLERRSYRSDKKNKDCDIHVAKRAEYRRAEAFGEVPKS
jgi:hypothetical protein